MSKIDSWMCAGTYMNSGIAPHKREYIAHDANAERKPLRLPSAKVCKGVKHILRICVFAEKRQREDDTKEAENMDDERQALELGEESRKGHIDYGDEGQDSPQDQGAVPRLGALSVLGMGQADDALDLGAGQQPRRSEGSLPSYQGQPPGDVSKGLLVCGRCQHTNPMVLAARRWCHGSHLGQGGHEGQLT